MSQMRYVTTAEEIKEFDLGDAFWDPFFGNSELCDHAGRCGLPKGHVSREHAEIAWDGEVLLVWSSHPRSREA